MSSLELTLERVSSGELDIKKAEKLIKEQVEGFVDYCSLGTWSADANAMRREVLEKLRRY